MSPEIMKRYILLPTAREIWKALSTTFYDGADELQVFTLNQKAFSAKQNCRSLSSYYGELIEIFCELDRRDKVIMENEKEVSSYRKSIQRQRVHIFLASLDGEFEQIRGKILRKDPVLELEECYSMVRCESFWHATMNGDLEKSKAATMVRKYRSNQNRFSQNQPDQMSRGTQKIVVLKLWDHNRDSRRRNASKSSTTAIVETNAKDDVVGQSTTLPDYCVFKNIQTRKTIGYGTR
ncbi:hypothetical protein KY289_016313 [Solanum tuberosum]|nr:hypothetical protein KY289_016313 [Solanum tuberosum]